MLSLTGTIEITRSGMNTQERALEHFLSGVEKKAFFTARLATRQEQEALDIVQTAMLKLVQNYRKNPAEEWAALFNRILHNCIMDWHRQQSRQKLRFWQKPLYDDTEEDDDVLAQIPTLQEQNPAVLLQQSQDIHLVTAVVEQLPFRQQQAFLLRVWEGFDGQQTSEIMGCSEGSVKTHLFRALQTLRQALGESK